jgi:hypothetical protein
LGNLKTIGGGLYINGGNSLLNIGGLNKLQTVGRGISVSYIPNLTNLDGLDNLQSVSGDFTILLNVNLEDLCGIKNLLTHNEGGVDGEVFIVNNAYNPTVEDIINGDCSL